MKVLSPVGNFESLKSAITNGADEVYLGINDFNARNIDSFTLDTLKGAVDYAHIYGVRVFLAINVLFSDDQLDGALETLIKAYNLGVDAFIVQDLALADTIHKAYPEIELHASTQMGLHNLEGVKNVLQYGFKRVVLSRETPLEEVKRIHDNCDVEIEYFVQGALCVSFSGNCYLSSYLFDASGNRGKCKQLCRLPYTLRQGGRIIKKGYLLSAKDFNMIDRLSDLKDAGVTSLKIEGRARRPYYVGIATRQYRNAVDGKPFDQSELLLAFNRGYTQGYFNGNSGIISKNQSHVGIAVGKVVKVENGKKFNRVIFTSGLDLSPKSTFKLFNGDVEVTTLTAYDLKREKDGKWALTTTQKVEKDLTVRLIADFQKESDLADLSLKRPVEISFELMSGNRAKAIVSVAGIKIDVVGEVCEKSLSRPLSLQDLQDCFNKSEYFTPIIVGIQTDGVFMPKSQLNAFRRNVYDKLINRLTTPYERQLQVVKAIIPKSHKKFDFEIVENLEQISKTTSKTVIYSPNEYSINDVKDFVKTCQDNGKQGYLDTPNFALKMDIELIKNIIEQTGVGIVANNYYALNLTDDYIVGWGLNVYNNVTASLYGKRCITAESQTLANKVDAPYMTLRHCPIKEHVGGNCDKCLYKEGLEYITDDGKIMKLKRKKLSSCTFYLTK